jgi:hypothetical protein
MRGLFVETCMPSLTGVVHDEGVPLRPAISTTQRRHDPKALSRSVEHNFGIEIPAKAAARMMEVSAGIVTEVPLISMLTISARLLAGVP